jgi:4-carboxymuconolactone decarboxylase
MTDNSKKDSDIGKERRARGARMINDVYAGMLSADPDKPTGDAFFDLMLENLFGEIWSREVLSIRDRRLLLMGAIAAQAQNDVYEMQCMAALKKEELTVEQLREVPILMTQYIGYPKTTGLRNATEKAIHNWKKANAVQEKGEKK